MNHDIVYSSFEVFVRLRLWEMRQSQINDASAYIHRWNHHSPTVSMLHPIPHVFRSSLQNTALFNDFEFTYKNLKAIQTCCLSLSMIARIETVSWLLPSYNIRRSLFSWKISDHGVDGLWNKQHLDSRFYSGNLWLKISRANFFSAWCARWFRRSCGRQRLKILRCHAA